MRDDLLLEVLHDTATAVRAALDGLARLGRRRHPARPVPQRPGRRRGRPGRARSGRPRRAERGVGPAPPRAPDRGGARPASTARPTPAATCPGTPPASARSTPTAPRAALVVDQAGGARFEASRGGGARRRRRAARSRPRCTDARRGPRSGCRATRPAGSAGSSSGPMGAAALDLCAVAGGAVRRLRRLLADAHGSWDYLGGMLVCQEAGALVVDAFDRPLATIEHAARRTPIAAATPALLAAAVAARRSSRSGPGPRRRACSWNPSRVRCSRPYPEQRDAPPPPARPAGVPPTARAGSPARRAHAVAELHGRGRSASSSGPTAPCCSSASPTATAGACPAAC